MSTPPEEVFARLSGDDRELLLEVIENWLSEGFTSDSDRLVRVREWQIALGGDPSWSERFVR